MNNSEIIESVWKYLNQVSVKRILNKYEIVNLIGNYLLQWSSGRTGKYNYFWNTLSEDFYKKPITDVNIDYIIEKIVELWFSLGSPTFVRDEFLIYNDHWIVHNKREEPEPSLIFTLWSVKPIYWHEVRDIIKIKYPNYTDIELYRLLFKVSFNVEKIV